MRAWLGGLQGRRDGNSQTEASSSENPSDRPAAQDATRAGPQSPPPANADRPWRQGGAGGGGQGRLTRQTSGDASNSGGGGGGVIQALMAGHRSHAAAAADAEMERRVAISARNLGDGVSRIVLAARMGGGGGDQPADWKARLLKLLGGSDGESVREGGVATPTDELGLGSPMGGGPMGGGTGAGVEEPSDIDVLLENSACERFVLRCVENELPPNLIHCLRLLRVLELQHDHAVAAQKKAMEVEGDEYQGEVLTPGPVSTQAAGKVSQLLCLLCADASVGEQLRPHLFGLLALSGASYPESGVHIASAASDVIRAFSANCLSASLVWFLHDRKMIVHMTDDIKELCAMTAAAAPSASNRGLYGADAEAVGLWVVALRTVVHLVSSSCNHQCVELLKDYDSAGGYHVLSYAISNSAANHVPKLLELVTVLVCCKIAVATPAGSLEGEGDGEGGTNADAHDAVAPDLAESKVAMNTNAFEIMDDLMMKSIGLLTAYKAGHGGARPSFDDGADLTATADFAAQYAWDALRKRQSSHADQTSNEAKVDLSSELLVTTLQLYSDHARNFDLIESEYHTLSHYILSFPTFEDVSVKVLALKTLEYVCTGLAGANSVMPLRVVTEVFCSLCKHLLGVASSIEDTDESDESKEALAALDLASQDLLMLCETLVKLLEFDENVSHVMLDCGLLGLKIDDMLELISAWVTKKGAGEESPTPTQSTKMDDIYACFCRILKLVARQPGARKFVVEGNGVSGAAPSKGSDCSSLTSLLTAGMLHLGDVAAQAALDVFEAMMAKNHDDILQEDMTCLLNLVGRFSPPELDGGDENDRRIGTMFLSRQTAILDMIRSILPSNLTSQDAFRKCGGFECIVRLLFRLQGAVPSNTDAGENEEKEGGEVTSAIMKLLGSMFSLAAAATDPEAKSLKQQGDLNTVPFAADLLDYTAMTSASTPVPPSTTNLLYLRNYGFYMEFGNAISDVGVLSDIENARTVMNLALELIHPKLVLSPDGRRTSSQSASSDSKTKGEDMISIRNADAARLVLGLATCLSHEDPHRSLAKNAFDELLRLCANDMAGSSLARLSNSGLCTSLTTKGEFAHMLDDRSHFLYSRFVLLLRRIAAFSMTYNDFVSLLRCVAGPILLADQEDRDVETDEHPRSVPSNKRIRLAVISSSVQNKKSASTSSQKSEAWQARESGLCSRLETLSVIAERGDRVARCEVGGDALNSIAMFMQKVPLEDRMYKLAEEGRLKFVEIESVDANAKLAGGSSSLSSQGGKNDVAAWSPLVSSGFTYCCWMRQHHPVKDGSQSSLFIFDISSPLVEKTSDGSGSFPYGRGGHEFFSVWYDIPHQRFCVLSSSNSRGEPTCFPISPLPAGVWHHIQLTYQAPKRSMMGRRAVITLYVDGRPIESEAKVEAFNLPPTARVHIGVPNPVLASSGIVRGALPPWDLGPTILVSSVLSLRDATAMYAAGPEFPGLFWGDRPQRLSLAASATSAFVMLAENGEKGSVAGALRRRKVPSMEAVGHVMRERGGFGIAGGGGPIAAGPESDSLSAVGLLCRLAPENVVFGFRASSSYVPNGSLQRYARCLNNISRTNSSTASSSTDALVYGHSSVISPNCFADNVQWIGGPNVLMPIVNAAQSSSSLALSLRMIRESARRHPPNLEMLQAGGGYRVLALLLRQKHIMDANVLDQCFAFAVHGFVPGAQEKEPKKPSSKGDNSGGPLSKAATHRWVLADLDAMKYLLLNHQVWDLNGAGPALPSQLLTYLNGLVVAHSTHAAFNSRRLHLLGIIRWTLHLMLEATELFAAGAAAAATKSSGAKDENAPPKTSAEISRDAAAEAALKNGWHSQPPLVSRVASGCDPGNEMLLGCKTLLRRVLTFMLTPGDLEAIAGAAIYTVSITGGAAQDMGSSGGLDAAQLRLGENVQQERLAPGAAARVYLLRLLEELVVDGVNEIVTDDAGPKHGPGEAGDPTTESTVEPHLGGGSSAGQGMPAQKKPEALQKSQSGANVSESAQQSSSKHQEAQIFLSAFAGILTPVWFACILEGCREEASASAVLRLMILMIQNSRKFAMGFEEAGGFAPLVLSVPKFSTCPSVILSLLSHLLHAPILHLPCFATLDSKQLCDVFDAESDAADLVRAARRDGSGRIGERSADPSCGIFALLAECLGRNIQLASFDNELGRKARNTNEAVLQLLSHRHAFSPSFQQFCRTPDFLEPLAQALCLVHDEKLSRMARPSFGDGLTNAADDNEDGTQPEAPAENAGSGHSGPEAQLSQSGSDGSMADDFVSWPSDKDGSRGSFLRRGSLCGVNTAISPTERFVGSAEEDEGSGIGMVQLLHLVLSHAVLQGPLAAPLVSALFRSFPIHASPDQVEAFHLVLIEHCRSVVEDVLQRGEPVAIANCIGVSSVLLDRLMAGFFTSEPVLEAVNIVMLTLNSLTASGTYASRTLANVDQNLLVADTAHLARLTCLIALQRSKPSGAYDEGDDDLKLAVLTQVGERMRQLLLVPSNLLGGQGTMRKQGGYNPPAPPSRFFPLWQSASLSRCSLNAPCAYPDLTAVEEPDRAFVVTLMADIHAMLLDKRQDIQEQAVVVVVSLLQRRRGIMSELLITDIPRGDHRMETVDLMNRGGFGALLVAHEATTIAENVSSCASLKEKASSGSGRVKYASFFEWLERNQEQVAAVFHGIHVQASRASPMLTAAGAITPEEAIENEQKVMLLKLTSQDSSDRTILGGLERAELAQRSHEATSESHALWKRQGFDDLSSGAMQWKFLLRQLKGSCTIWEGGTVSGNLVDEASLFAKSALVSSLTKKRSDTLESDTIDQLKRTANSNQMVKRWKLDLTEGYERQRRRLLPNYEFHGLYNIDEKADNVQYVDETGLRAIEDASDAPTADINDSGDASDRDDVGLGLSAEMEVTADLLKKMKLQKRHDDDEDDEIMDEEDDEDADDTSVIATHTVSGEEQSTQPSDMDSNVDAKKSDSAEGEGQQAEAEEIDKGNISASSYDLITGLLKAGDWPEKSYNVSRCTGLEVRKALLLWCRNAVYVVDGFEQTDGEGLKGKIKRLKKATASFQVNIRQHNSDDVEGAQLTSSEKAKGKEKSTTAPDSSEEEITYQHRSQRIAFSDLYSVYRRRYQLQQNALEFYDVHRNGTLIAFSTHMQREEVLSKVLSTPLPSSIFSSNILGGSTSINYKKFMNNLRAKITSQWVQGKITNFDFIMHMNSFAGRTYNDLTQYPVFPWVLSDYDSEEIDLNDPSVYRDFSKPMGAQAASRAVQFKERYQALEESYERGDGPPPFHYGTHYSCAAYVLYYLMRLEPFSRLAMSLQGGKFDVADRLFHNVGASWSSASSENLQDVRELIPEFFYLPDFLVNSNMFDFGTTQRGKTVHDLTLPRWAKGDPKRFVRIHRQALESDHVSRNLHRWLDLIFGYKQRGQEAVTSLNTFVHVTYEGQVDLDSIEDPVERESIIAQIQNFGQTPSRLERKPFPARVVVSAFKERGVDFSSLSSLATLTPPFCVVGAPQHVLLRASTVYTCKVGMAGQVDSSVGDMCYTKGQLVGVGRTCALILPSRKYIRFGGPNNGVSVHVAITSARYREVNKVLSIHDGMHRGPISVAKPSLNGLWLVTGGVDSTVRVWKYNGQNMQLQATLCGHDGGKITCLDVSTTFGSIVTGGSDGKILVWDLRTLTFLRQLNHAPTTPCSANDGAAKCFPAKSVSINHKNGNIVTLLHTSMCVFDINGNLVAEQHPDEVFKGKDVPSCAIATDCPEWMELGIAAVTGHTNGHVRLWGIDYDSNLLILRHILEERVHTCPITALRVSGDKEGTLLVGDAAGKISAWSTVKLEQLEQSELDTIVAEQLGEEMEE
ncbi:hypothetical protein ACHAXT_009304 [Thalassiosira profunda]